MFFLALKKLGIVRIAPPQIPTNQYSHSLSHWEDFRDLLILFEKPCTLCGHAVYDLQHYGPSFPKLP